MQMMEEGKRSLRGFRRQRSTMFPSMPMRRNTTAYIGYSQHDDRNDHLTDKERISAKFAPRKPAPHQRKRCKQTQDQRQDGHGSGDAQAHREGAEPPRIG